MFPQHARYSFKNGFPPKKIAASFFTLRYGENSEFHVAVVVSKKVSAKATVRNALKRKMLAALHSVYKEKSLQGDYVFFMRREAVDQEVASLKAYLDTKLPRTARIM